MASGYTYAKKTFNKPSLVDQAETLQLHYRTLSDTTSEQSIFKVVSRVLDDSFPELSPIRERGTNVLSENLISGAASAASEKNINPTASSSSSSSSALKPPNSESCNQKFQEMIPASAARVLFPEKEENNPPVATLKEKSKSSPAAFGQRNRLKGQLLDIEGEEPALTEKEEKVESKGVSKRKIKAKAGSRRNQKGRNKSQNSKKIEDQTEKNETEKEDQEDQEHKADQQEEQKEKQKEEEEEEEEEQLLKEQQNEEPKKKKAKIEEGENNNNQKMKVNRREKGGSYSSAAFDLSANSGSDFEFSDLATFEDDENLTQSQLRQPFKRYHRRSKSMKSSSPLFTEGKAITSLSAAQVAESLDESSYPKLEVHLSSDDPASQREVEGLSPKLEVHMTKDANQSQVDSKPKVKKPRKSQESEQMPNLEKQREFFAEIDKSTLLEIDDDSDQLQLPDNTGNLVLSDSPLPLPSKTSLSYRKYQQYVKEVESICQPISFEEFIQRNRDLDVIFN